ncbi:hypothetical protein, partial [Streptococcus pneumoniae]|uniref:hypothetical protein n=1 Tax=Streptococcus pneumoniae TaxID=1313 RepID=UPI0018B077C7
VIFELGSGLELSRENVALGAKQELLAKELITVGKKNVRLTGKGIRELMLLIASFQEEYEWIDGTGWKLMEEDCYFDDSV